MMCFCLSIGSALPVSAKAYKRAYEQASEKNVSQQKAAQGNQHGEKRVKVDGITYRIVNGSAYINAGKVDVKKFVIPGEITVGGTTYPVTLVENPKGKGGAWGDVVEEIVLPESVTFIAEAAFKGQSSLRQVTLGEGVEYISASAFEKCVNLQDIEFPERLKYIGAWAFQDCDAMKNVNIWAPVEEIEHGAFSLCDRLEVVNMYFTPLTRMNLEIFYGCDNLNVLGLPQHLRAVTETKWLPLTTSLGIIMSYETLLALKEAGETAFLSRINVLGLADAEAIDINVAEACPNASIVQLYWNVGTIGDYAFWSKDGTGKLTQVSMYNSVTRIGKSAFMGNPQLQEVELSDNLIEIGDYAFRGCAALEEVELPITIERIGCQAFKDCANLKRVTGLNSNINYSTFVHHAEDNVDNIVLEYPFEGTGVDFKAIEQTFSYYALGIIAKDLQEWQAKKEFETTAQWQQRVTPQARDERVKRLVEQARRDYMAKAEKPRWHAALGTYDADYNVYTIELGDAGEQYVQVPLSEAPAFKANFARADVKPTYGIKDDRLAVVGLEVTLDGRTYRNVAPVEEAGEILALNLPALEVNLEGGTPPPPVAPAMPMATDHDVDMNIPTTSTVAENTFAVIIGNEHYQHEAQVPFALNDATVFAEYCRKTLGIPEKNIRVLKDATLNNMKFQLDWLQQVLTAYNGEARAIVYYAGHGIPDEKNQSAYLLPADGYGSNTGTGFSLADFYATLATAPAKSVTVFLDACFSGTKRESGMLTAARGVAIKVRAEAPRGNMVVFTAAQGDETAYQYAEKGHGMFTYFLLKKLQETRGDVTLGELGNYLTVEVKKASVVNNNKMQTPSVIPAPGMTGWKEQYLK